LLIFSSLDLLCCTNSSDQLLWLACDWGVFMRHGNLLIKHSPKQTTLIGHLLLIYISWNFILFLDHSILSWKKPSFSPNVKIMGKFYWGKLNSRIKPGFIKSLIAWGRGSFSCMFFKNTWVNLMHHLPPDMLYQ
jgi:hypothetical protein